MIPVEQVKQAIEQKVAGFQNAVYRVNWGNLCVYEFVHIALAHILSLKSAKRSLFFCITKITREKTCKAPC
jgi:hypothetical protein